jgi:polysaccharide pyruvyl transferase WcaK-like protein
MEGVETHLVGHVISESQPVEDDFRANQALGHEFPGVVLAPRFESPSEAKSYIAGMDFFMGARMHACIAAFSSGVPVIPMAYSRKFAGLFGTLGYDHTVDCTAETNEAILEKTFEGFENRAGLKAEVEAAFARAEARLAPYEAALRATLGELAAR